jgi:Flp pilus assembly protein TadG
MRTIDRTWTHARLAVTRESAGQILVVFAGALVALLLIAALVVDLGSVFNMKRHEQNAADPGAVAAARYITPTLDKPAMWTAACFYAVDNGFRAKRTDTSALCPGAGTADGSTVTVNYPPSTAAGEFAGQPGYVEVVVKSTHQSFLAGLIGLGQIPVTSDAVAANDAGTGASSSLVALNPTMCSAGKVHGGGGAGGLYIFPATGVTEAGGYIQINSNCGTGDAKATNDTCTDSNNNGGFSSSGGTTVTGTGLYVQGACDVNGASADFHIPASPLPAGCTVSSCVVDEGASFVGDPLSLVRPPRPTDLVIRQCPTGPVSTAISPKTCNLGGTVTLDPGTYYGGWNIGSPGTSITLNPGIYVIAGGGISDTGGALTSASGRVFIFSTDASATWKTACIAGTGTNPACQGKLSMAGGTSLHLIGLDPTAACPPYSTSGCPYGGLLMWQDGKGSAAALGGSPKCDIALGGSGSLYLSGTIYAPCGNVTINGTSTASGCDLAAPTQDCAAVQIISDSWDVGGGAILNMPYDPNGFYHLSLKGLVK